MSLKLLRESERDLILAWRNAPPVRTAMYNSHEISLDSHRAWFKRMSQDVSSAWYLYRHGGAPTGVVYFTDIDAIHQTAVWGFYAKPEAPPGTGTRLMREALDMAFNSLQIRKLNAEVLGSNRVSIHLHKKCGFAQEGLFRSHHFDGQRYVDVVRFGLFATEWRKAIKESTR